MHQPTEARVLRKIARVGIFVGALFVALTLPVPLLLAGHSSDLEMRVVDYLLLWSIALPSFVAFFGMYRVRGDIRDGIAGGFVISFFCILFLSVELNFGNFDAAAGSIRQVAVSNFMTLVGTIIVFYFGSEAAIRVGDPYVRERAQRALPAGETEGGSSTRPAIREGAGDI